MDRDAILVVDGAEILNYARQSIPTFEPRHRLNSGPFGTMGANPNLISFPAYAYPHTLQPGYNQNQVGCSIDGGFVYRGAQIPTPWTRTPGSPAPAA